MKFIAILLLGCLFMTACGQTGKLYLPDDEKSQLK